jgi:hypothetical protein
VALIRAEQVDVLAKSNCSKLTSGIAEPPPAAQYPPITGHVLLLTIALSAASRDSDTCGAAAEQMPG